jgi:hypothetical protein
MSEVEISSYGDLFAETPDETINFNEVTEEVKADEPVEESQETPLEESTEESVDTEEQPAEETEPETIPVIAKIEIDGKEFEFDEPRIQHLAEQYIELATQNKEMIKHREVVQEAMGYIENIKRGVDIDEAMVALGVDFDKLITDKVKEFIRRSTMSQKERDMEDMRTENEKLRKEREERLARETAEREEADGRKHAEEIFSNVKTAISNIPEKFQQEVQIELLSQIEKKIRSGGVRPSARAIANAASIIYERKQKLVAPEVPKPKQVPKPVRNSATPSTQVPKTRYNATDYNEIFKRG